MKNARTLFLDTTIQIDRITETNWRKEIIKNKLTGHYIASCTLILREFKERIIHKCVALLEIVRLCDNRADVETEISRNFAKTAILLKVMGQVDRETQTQTQEGFDKELVIETIKTYIEGGMEKRFNLGISRISDKTRCEMAREKVRLKNDCYRLKVGCNRQEVNCNLPDFIADHADAMEAIAKRAAGASTSDERKELEKIASVYCDARNKGDFNLVKGRTNCNILSDVVIALEAPEGSAVYTTDRDYEYICPIVGRCCIREDYSTASSP